MAVQIFTVDQYRDHVTNGAPLPGGTTIQIVDSDDNIAMLNESEFRAFDDNGVTSLRADDGTLDIDMPRAMALLETNISFDAADTVTIADTTGKLGLMFFSAPEIAALSNKNVDFIGINGGIPLPTKIGAAQAKALANSNISLTPGSYIFLADDGADISRLSANEFSKLAANGLTVIDTWDDKLTLSFDQFKVLEVPESSPIPTEMIMFNPYDTVTVELRASELTGLTEEQLATMANRGVDVLSIKDAGSVLSALSVQQIEALKSKGAAGLDASDDVLSLTLAQYNALNGMTFAANDSITLSLSVADTRALSVTQATEARAKGVDNLIVTDNGQALASLSADEIAALSAKGVSLLDATDNKLALSLAQYNALGSVRLSDTDVVSVAASGNAVLHAGGTDLTLTGSAIRGTGNSLANTITGNAKNNILSGLEGDDVLSGGLGNDQLRGGAGKDVFVFDTKPNKSKNVDKILDFKSKDDSIYLDNKIFTKLGSGTPTNPKKLKSDMFVEGTKAKDKGDRIVYDKKTGSLYYDQDGTGSKAQVKIATLSNKEKLYFHDFFVI